MAKNDMYESSIRTKGDFGVVFEYDGDTCYFYLYKIKSKDKLKIIAHNHIFSRTQDFEQKDIEVCWDHSETKVGLYIRDQLWAVYDVETNAKYGGNYHPGSLPDIPLEILNYFEPIKNNSITFCVSSYNEDINGAIQKACRTVDYFLSIFNSNDESYSGFSVKAKLKDEDKIEHVWLKNLEYSNGKFKGTINNKVELFKNIKEGDLLEVDKDSITDWLYSKNGKKYGNFTYKAAISKLPLNQQVEILKNYGDIDELNKRLDIKK